MKNYYLVNHIPKQPYSDLRCHIVDDQNGAEYVMVQMADLRVASCPQAIAKRINLKPCE